MPDPVVDHHNEIIAQLRLDLAAARDRIATLEKERDEARFSPMGDNHHNAAWCPYCRSQTDAGTNDRIAALGRDFKAVSDSSERWKSRFEDCLSRLSVARTALEKIKDWASRSTDLTTCAQGPWDLHVYQESRRALASIGEPGAANPTRDERQKQVADWCVAAFGAEHQASVPQRAIRMLEEAIEAYQAAGCDAGRAHKLVDYIFAKEPGALHQEIGGIGLTLLAFAQAAGFSADAEEYREIARVLAKPLEHFAARNKVKNDAGFNVIEPTVGEEKP